MSVSTILTGLLSFWNDNGQARGARLLLVLAERGPDSCAAALQNKHLQGQAGTLVRMCTRVQVAAGSINASPAEKRALAAASLEYNMRSPIFRCAHWAH